MTITLKSSAILFALMLFLCCKKEENNPTSNTVTDIDGNVYKTITIGDQIWMAENLKTTKYNNGTDIPLVTDSAAWSDLSEPGYSWYNNNEETYKKQYGALYNWHAVNTGKLCPTGWHVPSDAEWKELEIQLGMSLSNADSTGWRGTDEGGKLKEAGYLNWTSPNIGATNESKFSALPGGNRNSDGTFGRISTSGYWWSATENNDNRIWYRRMYYNNSNVARNLNDKQLGFSVRCIKD